jgi:probable addiction module antidote protein
MANKYKGSSFDDYLLQSLRDDDQMVFLHIREALENPHIDKNSDYQYLIKAINDVVKARGKSALADKAGITRQALHKILSGESIPSVQNIMAILGVIGLRFSVKQVANVISSDDPASVLDVAQYAVVLLPRNSTYMKLQKIVYYSQVESLVHYNRPLFKEKIEAWAAGPVVRELFETHKGFRYSGDKSIGQAGNLSMEQKSCVDWAIEKYGKLDGDTLSHLTHLEDPWKNARKGLTENARSDREITTEAMLTYYSNLPNYSELEEKELSAPDVGVGGGRVVL